MAEQQSNFIIIDFDALSGKLGDARIPAWKCRVLFEFSRNFPEFSALPALKDRELPGWGGLFINYFHIRAAIRLRARYYNNITRRLSPRVKRGDE